MHKSIHYHIHCLRLVRCSIPLPIDITIASSTPSHYSTIATPYSLTSLNTNSSAKLLRLQNAIVRCFHLLPRRSSDLMTPLLKQLHWLPVPYRIMYKLSLTIHKAIHHNYTDYLASLLHIHTPITPLQTRSSNTFILTIPIYTNSTPAPLPYLPLTGIPNPITYEQTHQRPPLNATLRLIISPLPSLPLNNSLLRMADYSRTDAIHKQQKMKKE